MGRKSTKKDMHDVVTIFSKKKENRARYNTDNDIETQIMERCTMRSKLTVNPIIHWSDADVWSYIRENEISYCRLYDEGFKRLGCIGCPMAGGRGRMREFARWPHMERYYRKGITDMLARDPERFAMRYGWRTVDDVWHWWLEDGVLPGQMEMDLEEIV